MVYKWFTNKKHSLVRCVSEFLKAKIFCMFKDLISGLLAHQSPMLPRWQGQPMALIWGWNLTSARVFYGGTGLRSELTLYVLK